MFSTASGCGPSSQIEKETLKKRITNVEQGITNIEVRYSISIIFESGYLERTSVLDLWERLAAAIVLIRGCKPLPQVPFWVT